MSLRETVDNVYEYFKENLNPYLEKQGLAPFKRFLKSTQKIDVVDYSIAIYPTLTSGSMLSFDEDSENLTMSIFWSLDKRITEETQISCIDYWIALTDFVKETHFGITSKPLESAAFRMDEGHERNGGGILLEIQTEYLMDSENNLPWE